MERDLLSSEAPTLLPFTGQCQLHEVQDYGHRHDRPNSHCKGLKLFALLDQYIGLCWLCVVALSGPIQMIVEFAPHGNLNDYLRKRVPQFELSDTVPVDAYHPLQPALCPLPFRTLISFAYQVSRGMEYLASVNVNNIYS